MSSVNRYRNMVTPHEGPAFYETSAPPTVVGEYKVFERALDAWDIVRFGACLEIRPDRASALTAAKMRAQRTGRTPRAEHAAALWERYGTRKDLLPLDRLPAHELDSLVRYTTVELKDTSVEREVAEDFRHRHGIARPVSWGHKEVWISVEDLADAEPMKRKLRAMGYDYVETFKGSLHEEPEQGWIVRGAITRGVFDDPKGHSKRTRELLVGLHLEPMYVYAHGGQCQADFELTGANLGALQAFLQSATERFGDELHPLLLRNRQEAVDVVTLSLAQPPGAHAKMARTALSIEQLLDEAEALGWNSLPARAASPGASNGLRP